MGQKGVNASAYMKWKSLLCDEHVRQHGAPPVLKVPIRQVGDELCMVLLLWSWWDVGPWGLYKEIIVNIIS